jgi:hypothetical protein
MNKILMTMAIVASTVATAKEECQTSTTKVAIISEKVIDTKVPKHLKGAVIIVRLPDGTETSVPAEKFKVVPRKQQIVTGSGVANSSVTQCTRETVVEKMVKADSPKNRVSLSAGKGPKGGLQTSRDGDTVSVETKTGVIGGAQYQRVLDGVLDDKVSVGGTVQTNKSILVGVGVDF